MTFSWKRPNITEKIIMLVFQALVAGLLIQMNFRISNSYQLSCIHSIANLSSKWRSKSYSVSGRWNSVAFMFEPPNELRYKSKDDLVKAAVRSAGQPPVNYSVSNTHLCTHLSCVNQGGVYREAQGVTLSQKLVLYFLNDADKSGLYAKGSISCMQCCQLIVRGSC